MQILTQRIDPPIPTRQFDWTAVYEGYDDGDPIGYGHTEQAAIGNLMGQQGATCEEVAQELASRGFSDARIKQFMETQQ